ncbi:MAG: hypothetical protein WCK31_05060, partial [bacterium]
MAVATVDTSQNARVYAPNERDTKAVEWSSKKQIEMARLTDQQKLGKVIREFESAGAHVVDYTGREWKSKWNPDIINVEGVSKYNDRTYRLILLPSGVASEKENQYSMKVIEAGFQFVVKIPGSTKDQDKYKLPYVRFNDDLTPNLKA